MRIKSKHLFSLFLLLLLIVLPVTVNVGSYYFGTIYNNIIGITKVLAEDYRHDNDSEVSANSVKSSDIADAVIIVFACFFLISAVRAILNSKRATYSEKLLETLLNNAKTYVIIFDENARIKNCSRLVLNILGREKHAVVGKTLSELITNEATSEKTTKYFGEGAFENGTLTFIDYTGALINIIFNSFDFHCKGKKEHISIGIDITETMTLHKEIERTLDDFHNTTKSYELAIAAGGVGLLRYNVSTGRVAINISGALLLGYENEIRMDLNQLFGMIHAEDTKTFKDMLDSSVKDDSKKSFSVSMRISNRNCGFNWFLVNFASFIEENRLHKIVTGTFVDINHMKEYEIKMNTLVYRDSVTKVFNKPKFLIEGEKLLTKARQLEMTAFMMYLDIDNFKSVNMQKGESFGDRLLRDVAKSIKSALTDDAIISRQSGDEFIVLSLQNNHHDIRDIAEQFYQKVLNNLGKINARTYGQNIISIRAGVSIYPTNGTTTAKLIDQSVLALIATKQTGSNKLRFYDTKVIASIQKVETLKGDMQTCDFFNQLEVYYQPQVSTEDELIFGAEALVRWNHPEYGFLTPLHFISLAEDMGIISDIDWWCLEETCKNIYKWTSQGLSNISVSVNISAVVLYDDTLISRLKEIIKKTGIDTGCLDFELTERIAVQNLSVSIERIKQIKSLGINISLDDFGTGYSSLNYLHKIPSDKIKIDRSFFEDIETNNHGRTIVAALVSLAKQLNLKTIAEGVETKEQWRFVKEVGCDYIQGYLFGKPMPVKDFEALIMK